MNKNFRHVASVTTLAAGLIVTAGALAQAPMPQPQMQGNIAYLNGGAGDEEVQYVKQSMKDYSMALAFAHAASPRAEYVANVAVSIKDGKGKAVFEAPAVGPYLLLKLPAGSYAVTATYQGQAQTRTVSAGKSGALVTFEWK